jgi:hypothetical protein
MDTKEKKPKYSKKELLKMRDDNTAFLREQIEHLAVQDSYQAHKANIAENNLRELVAKTKYAQMISPANKPAEAPEKTKE